jgi:hypothetical protein
MKLELRCPHCHSEFSTPSEPADTAMLEEIFDDHPCCALGDGETFEDMISAALAQREPVPCPDCGTRLEVSEESLGRIAWTMLSRI